VILDIFSRYVVGWMVAHEERAALARKLIEQSCRRQGITPGALTLHADRGPAMTSKPVALLLSDLGVTKTHSRPYVSNDNPFSEAQFKTMKYRPDFPERFGSIQHARGHGHVFFPWYNTEHRHSGLGMLTPHEVHSGLAEQRVEARARVLAAAFAAHPERFVAGLPRPPALPSEVWINKPKAALAKRRLRDSEAEVVTHCASRAPHSHAADSTLTEVSPRIGVRERFGSIGTEPHIAAVAPLKHGGSTLNSGTHCLILIDRLRATDRLHVDGRGAV
jgi:integrase-like protein